MSFPHPSVHSSQSSLDTGPPHTSSLPHKNKPRPLPRNIDIPSTSLTDASGARLANLRRNLSLDVSSPTNAFRPSPLKSPAAHNRSASLDSPLRPGFGYQVPLALDPTGQDPLDLAPRNLDL